MQEFQVLGVLEPTLRMKAQADSSTRDRKDFIWREEKGCTVENAGGPGGPWGLGFYSLFEYCLRAELSLRCADRMFLGRGGVSLTTYHLLVPPAVCPSPQGFLSLYLSYGFKNP
jgi:hypothetical protein